MSTPAPDSTERTAPADTEPLCPAQPPELHSTVSQLRESLSLLEVELVKLTHRDPAQQLKDQGARGERSREPGAELWPVLQTPGLQVRDSEV
ncbi:UNVERIFIED_CONTAM: hypothetical protein FKN15_071965 [Acipenser sinensis]